MFAINVLLKDELQYSLRSITEGLSSNISPQTPTCAMVLQRLSYFWLFLENSV